MAEEESKKLLVVDDDKEFTRVVQIYFERSGFEVGVAENGLRALEEFEIFRPDAIILDIYMPVMDGVKVLKFIRVQKNDQSTPIIALTGYHDEEKEKEVKEAGATVYLTKPIDMSKLRKKIEDVIVEVQPED